MKKQTAALLGLLEREGYSLHAMLFRLTLRQDVAEDLMQELFLKLRLAPGFAAAQDQGAYVRRAAFNLAMDWRRARRPGVSLDQMVGELIDHSASPLKRLVQAEQWDRILDAACQLTELCRDAFLLRFVEQESYELIAAQLGKTPHQVRALCHKAVEQFRSEMAEPQAELGRKEGCHVPR